MSLSTENQHIFNIIKKQFDEIISGYDFVPNPKYVYLKPVLLRRGKQVFDCQVGTEYVHTRILVSPAWFKKLLALKKDPDAKDAAASDIDEAEALSNSPELLNLYSRLTPTKRVKLSLLSNIANALYFMSAYDSPGCSDKEIAKSIKTNKKPGDYNVYNRMVNIYTDLHMLHKKSFFMRQAYVEELVPLKRFALINLSEAKRFHVFLLTLLFNDWCLNSYMHHDFSNITICYPARAALSLNNVQKFRIEAQANKKGLFKLLPNEYRDMPTDKFQERLLKAYGVAL